MSKSNLGEERIYLADTPVLQFISEGNQGRNSRPEPGGKNWSRNHGGNRLLACSVYFLMLFRGATSQSTRGPLESIKKIFPQMCPWANLMEVTPQLRFLPYGHA